MQKELGQMRRQVWDKFNLEFSKPEHRLYLKNYFLGGRIMFLTIMNYITEECVETLSLDKKE